MTSSADEYTEWEKQTEAVTQLAVCVHLYYTTLIEQGMPKQLADMLTLAYQNAILQISTRGPGDGMPTS